MFKRQTECTAYQLASLTSTMTRIIYINATSKSIFLTVGARSTSAQIDGWARIQWIATTK